MTPQTDGLAEFSVVFTDRALNHMSQRFQGVMHDLSTSLRAVYKAEAVALVPGGGTYAMESVARQLTAAGDQPSLVVRNGWFSFGLLQCSKQLRGTRPSMKCSC